MYYYRLQIHWVIKKKNLYSEGAMPGVVLGEDLQLGLRN
jgi:hypothetical protein